MKKFAGRDAPLPHSQPRTPPCGMGLRSEDAPLVRKNPSSGAEVMQCLCGLSAKEDAK